MMECEAFVVQELDNLRSFSCPSVVLLTVYLYAESAE